MKKSRYSEEQIIGFLREADAGMPIKELCRKGGFSDATFYKWRAKFGGMEVSDAKRLRELEGENAKLKKLLAEAHLDMHALKSVFGVKRYPRKPGVKRSGRSSSGSICQSAEHAVLWGSPEAVTDTRRSRTSRPWRSVLRSSRLRKCADASATGASMICCVRSFLRSITSACIDSTVRPSSR